MLEETALKAKTLFYNCNIYTQTEPACVNSIALYRNRIAAVGNNLQHDPDFASYAKCDLRGRTIIPGLVDAHTHLYYFALSLGRVFLDAPPTIDACLETIQRFASRLPANEWVVGEGYAPDRFNRRLEPDRYLLDSVTGGRPAFIFSKDQHSAWVNSLALEIAGITRTSPDPDGGVIVRDSDGEPIGILREGPAYLPVHSRIPLPPRAEIRRRYHLALDHAYKKGVTGVHSFDGPDALPFFEELAETQSVGLRVNYYPAARLLPALLKSRTYYGTGTELFRIAGIKLFADGSLGSQTAHCFQKYLGSKDNYGIATASVDDMAEIMKQAGRLGLPCAVHAIGDHAVSNVLDALESAAPRLHFGARHRIEHLQLIRRADIASLKRLGVVASMQPSHCPSDIDLIRTYWGKRGANAFIFRTLVDKGIDLAFGSDAPIEPLDPIAGIAAAVRRAKQSSRDLFYPDQRISIEEALFRFTAGPAIAAGQQHCRGYLLPGYPADLVILDEDITRTAPSKLYQLAPAATILDGKIKYCHASLKL